MIKMKLYNAKHLKVSYRKDGIWNTHSYLKAEEASENINLE